MERWQININGIVQGVGFRPFIYNLARQYQLVGFVANSSSGVDIEVEGPADQLQGFRNSIQKECPPLSLIQEIKTASLPLAGESEFRIIASRRAVVAETMVSPDVAVCSACLRELFDPDDRRYRYPFINCTNCGPRYTIIKDIPYDRPFTSMKPFKMCPRCQAEYDDPENRRFHAQPNACPECGPSLSLWDSQETLMQGVDEIQMVAELLSQGFIIALKGLGGFHLAVDARNGTAVRTLRMRKLREEKPLAIMVKDTAMANELCQIHDRERALLTSYQSPIVLLKKNQTDLVTDLVAPGNDRLGVMLPYTPLHHLLLQEVDFPLVMTSANLSEEPIVIDNREAFSRLQGIADYFLLHNRDIYLRTDDSVVVVLNDQPRLIRRSRGYVPRPVFVHSQGPPVLAVGGELKNTVCLLKQNQAIVSQHVGDLANLRAYDFFTQTIQHLRKLFQVDPELIVHDLHPNYLSTKWAREQPEKKRLEVQHHHAHLASVMAENHVDQPVIGIIMDGTGYGTDGTIWGGEFLIGDCREYERFAHFETMPLPGGDAAIKEPWRIAVSYLYETFHQVPELECFAGRPVGPILEMLDKNLNCPRTSSCGRLFDAVAVLGGCSPVIRYEAQAAIEWMQQVKNLNVRPLDYQLEYRDQNWILLIQPLLRSVMRAIKNGEPTHRISSRFHRTLIELFLEVVRLANKETGINSIVVSGGVFQNQILFEGLITRLTAAGYQVYSHRHVPTNDGGISLGQAVIGRQYLLDQG